MAFILVRCDSQWKDQLLFWYTTGFTLRKALFYQELNAAVVRYKRILQLNDSLKSRVSFENLHDFLPNKCLNFALALSQSGTHKQQHA